MNVLQGIQHVSFDLWLTLIKSDPVFKPLRNELFARHFGLEQRQDAVAHAFRHFDLLFNMINERTGGNVQEAEMLYVILDHLGVPAGEVPAAALEQYYGEMEQLFWKHHPLLLEPATATVLDLIRSRGCTINILSNTGFIKGSTLRPVLQLLGIDQHFSFQLYSDEMGYSKPAPVVYEHVFREAQKLRNLEKAAVLHIGDNRIADVEGARQFGFMSVLLDQENTLRNLFLN